MAAPRSACAEIVAMQHGRRPMQVARADFEHGPHHPYHELLARSVSEPRRGWLDDLPAAVAARIPSRQETP